MFLCGKCIYKIKTNAQMFEKFPKAQALSIPVLLFVVLQAVGSVLALLTNVLHAFLDMEKSVIRFRGMPV